MTAADPQDSPLLAVLLGRELSAAELERARERLRELQDRGLSRGAALCVASHELGAQPCEVAA